MSAATFAQNCKYGVDKVDPISGKRVLAIKVNINYWYNISFLRLGDEYRVESVVYMPGEQNGLVTAGTPIDIKLVNDKIITAESSSDAAPVSYISGTQIYSVYLMSYVITAEQARSIAASGIKYSKTHLLAEKYYEHMYKDKETEKTQHAASCVYSGGASAPVAKTTTTTTTKTAKEKEDDSLVESMMRKKQEKKAKEEAAEKAKTEPAPAKPQSTTTTTTPAASTPTAAAKPAPAPPANTSTQSPITVTPLSGADELMKWKKLLDQGIITKEEFDAHNKKILDK
ncbi:MAG: hypothetical protein JWO03_3535 [Bacteroidetes bacterium]|nr:hypothetical protein [Bacteroidota bacterium]